MKIKEFILENEFLKVTVLDLGCTFKSIQMKRGVNTTRELLLGFENNEEYINNGYFLGSTIGRIAGRISNSSFKIDQREILLNANEKTNFLHGGSNGLHNKIFENIKHEKDELIFKTILLEKDDNIPGDIKLFIKISLVDNKIKITYSAETNKKTILNLTNHSYWNFNEDKSQKITNHELFVKNGKLYDLDEKLIPNGIKFNIDWNDKVENIISQIPVLENGIDHFIETPEKKIVLKMNDVKVIFKTSDPGFVVYTGNFIKNLKAKNKILNQNTGICIEDQNFQNSINNGFSNWVLTPEEKFEKETTWEFINHS